MSHNSREDISVEAHLLQTILLYEPTVFIEIDFSFSPLFAYIKYDWFYWLKIGAYNKSEYG